MKAATRISILLADDHAVVREGLRKLLESEADLDIVGEAQTGREAVALAKTLRPAVVLMDIAMPQLNGLEATRQIRQAVPEVRVLILSAHSDDAYVEQAIAFGAAGFLLKHASSHELSRAIRRAHQGETVFTSSIAKRLQRQQQESLNLRGLSKAETGRLTSREMEVLQRIAEGAPNKQIADDLGISIKTVEKHRDHLMKKLDIHDTASLTRYAIAVGIIESSVQLTVV